MLDYFFFVSELGFYNTGKNIVQKGTHGHPLICQRGNQVRGPEVALST
jgi:hypothetical protein